LAGRTDGYLFHNFVGNPWDASTVLDRKLNALLGRLEIPKLDLKLLAKIIGKDRRRKSNAQREALGLIGAARLPLHKCDGDGFVRYPAANSQAAHRAQ
jgi:hypothetical protein